MTFFDEDGKRVLTDAVKEAERQTSGEIVIVVRPASDAYRHVDLLVGLLLSAAALCVFLYHPDPFDFTYLPLELLAVFAVGFVSSLGIPPLKRALVPRGALARAARRGAREAFVDRGIHRTHRRTGVLVCVSTFERCVELVADVGIDPAAFDDAWSAVRRDLERAVRRADVPAFAAAIVALGRALAKPLPRHAGDENELPDAPLEVA